jgi:hypothetical protein
MHFTTTLLVAVASLGLVAASDVCPGTYCQPGGRCSYDPNGPHCCSGQNDHDVVSTALTSRAYLAPTRNLCIHFSLLYRVASMRERAVVPPQLV